MSDYSPGVPSMRAAGIPVTHTPYAKGDAAVRQSLDAIALKAREARLDSAIIGWAEDAVREAGNPTTTRGVAQAILDKYTREVSFIPDPAGAEYVSSAAATLCLRPNLCLKKGDCDDGVVTTAGALLSRGYSVVVTKQNFGPDKQEHVITEVYDAATDTWLPVDAQPDENGKPLRVGTKRQAKSEQSMDPMSTVGSAGTAGAEIVTLGKAPTRELFQKGGYWFEYANGHWYVWNGTEWVIGPRDRKAESLGVGGRKLFSQGLGYAPVGVGDVSETSVGDVLAYRLTWDAYVTGVAQACQTCATAWRAQAAGQAPSTLVNLLQFAVLPDATTETLWADGQDLNADSIMAQWNEHAGLTDAQIVQSAPAILQSQQQVVLQVGQLYVPQLKRDCPGIALPEIPSFDAQAQIIGRLEGLKIVAHGELELIGIATNGALETFGAIGTKIGDVGNGAGDFFASPVFWGGLTLVGVGVGLYTAWPWLEKIRARAKK